MHLSGTTFVAGGAVALGGGLGLGLPAVAASIDRKDVRAGSRTNSQEVDSAVGLGLLFGLTGTAGTAVGLLTRDPGLALISFGLGAGGGAAAVLGGTHVGPWNSDVAIPARPTGGAPSDDYAGPRRRGPDDEFRRTAKPASARSAS